MKNNHIYAIAGVLLSMMTFAACGPLGKYHKTEKVDDNLYGNAVELSDSSANLALMNWKDFFQDEKLRNLIDTALVRNLDLNSAYENVVQAKAALKGAKLAYIPSLSITPDVSASIGRGMKPLYSYSVTASASWELDIFGRLATNVRKNKASADETAYYRQAVQASVVESVANTYYNLLMLDADLEMCEKMEKVWAKSVETIHAMKREGFADEVAVQRYESTYTGILISLMDIKAGIRQAENAMNLLLAKTPGPIERGELNAQLAPEKYCVGIPVQMLSLRPDVKSAQKEMEVAFYNTKSAWLNFFPSLTIGGEGGIGNAFGAAQPLSILGNFVAGLTVPVLSAGKNITTLKIVESQQRQAKMNFEKTLLNAGKEVNDALSKIENCESKSKWYEIQVEALNMARNDTELLMQNSEDKTYLDVLSAHNSLFEAEISQIANKAERMQSYVRLYTALGGGSF